MENHLWLKFTKKFNKFNSFKQNKVDPNLTVPDLTTIPLLLSRYKEN